jgi:hypothetical protein
MASEWAKTNKVGTQWVALQAGGLFWFVPTPTPAISTWLHSPGEEQGPKKNCPDGGTQRPYPLIPV